MSKQSFLPRRVARTLADGTQVEYWYDRATGQRTAPPSAAAIDAARDGRLTKAAFRAHSAEGPDAAFGDIIAAWQMSPHWADLSPATRRMHVATMRMPSLAYLRAMPCRAIETRHLAQLRDQIAMAGLNSHGRKLTGAANQMLNTIASCWKWAQEARGIGPNPCADVSRFRNQKSFAPWSDEDLSAWLQQGPPAIARVIRLACWTALRRADLLTMTWSAWDGSAIYAVPQKTRHSSGTRLRLPLSPEANAALAEWRAEAEARGAGGPEDLILTDPKGRPWGELDRGGHAFKRFEKAWVAARRDNGLPNRTLHGVRATVATRLYDTGSVATHDIMAVTGHTTEKAFLRYVGASDQNQRAERAAAVLATVLPAAKE